MKPLVDFKAIKEKAVRKQTEGRCPDCGELVLVEVRRGRPAEVPPHGCRSRACEYPGCRIKGFMDEMAQLGSGEWYCPVHGLLATAKNLVSLFGPQGEADWVAIAKIIGKILPDIIAKIESRRA